MAIVFGKRSSYLAWMRLKQLLVVFGLLGLMVLFLQYQTLFIGAGLVGALGVMIFVYFSLGRMRRAERKFGRVDRGMFGEDRIALELKKLPDEFVVLRGIKAGPHQDIDVTVVGPTGIFVVEVKSHRGVITYDGRRLLRNGRWFEKNIMREVMNETLALRALVREHARLDVFVEPVIVFSNRTTVVHIGPGKVGGARVIGISWLNDLLVSDNACPLDCATIYQIAAALAPLTNDRARDQKLARLKDLCFPVELPARQESKNASL